MRVVVIGGGISGLASALRLSKAGAQVTLLEASDQLGGLGTFFENGGRWIDRFYHCIMPSDDHLLQLIDEVGLTDQLYWRPTKMGFIVGGDRYPFNTAVDLLRFRPLSFFERLRFGATSLLLRRLGQGKDLDGMTSAAWLAQIYGQVLWDKVWAPLYRAKFGDAVDEIPALYIWQRLGREKNNSTRGYLRCGHKGLIDAIADSIRAYDGNLRLSTPVATVEEDGETMRVTLADGEVLDCDWVISTVPLPLLLQLIEGTSLRGKFRDPGLKYQGVVNTLFFLSRPLEGYYWIPVLGSNTEFDGIVEMSTLVDVAQYGDRHLVYAVKYTDRGSQLFAEPDEVIAERWKKQLLELFDGIGLGEGDILETRVFRAPFVEPAYPIGYSSIKPEIRSGDSRLLLATTSQIYPNITSWNSSTRLAGEVVGVLEDAERALGASSGASRA